MCGIACVLLIVLWVRSYWQMDHVYGYTSPTAIMHFGTIQGQLVYRRYQNSGGEGIPSNWMPQSESVVEIARHFQSGIPNDDEFYVYRHSSRFGFGWLRDGFFMPLLLPALIASVFAVAPWLHQIPWRFSLRTLLIATTLIAVLLGIIVWMTRAD
jgi:hypothetical protein